MLETTAVALLEDPSTPPEMIASVAGQFPNLWGAVEAHPNAYPELLEWIRQSRAYQASLNVLETTDWEAVDVLDTTHEEAAGAVETTDWEAADVLDTTDEEAAGAVETTDAGALATMQGEFSPTPQSPKTKNARRSGLGILVTVVVGLGVVGALVAGVVWFRSALESDVHAVENFMAALAEGDAETAREYLNLDTGMQYPFLTDEVLAVSNTLGPVSDVVVTGGTAEGKPGEMSVSYTVAGKKLTQPVEMVDGKITAAVLAELSFSQLGDVEPTINGVPAEGDVFLFPGAYSFGTAFEQYQFPNEDGISQIRGGDGSGTLYRSAVTLQLTEEGEEQFRAALLTSLEDCLRSTSLSSDCGMDISKQDMADLGYPDVDPIDGTVERTLAEGSAAVVSQRGALSLDNSRRSRPTTFVWGGSKAWEATFYDTNGDSWVVSSDGVGLFSTRATIDFATTGPVIVWQSGF